VSVRRGSQDGHTPHVTSGPSPRSPEEGGGREKRERKQDSLKRSERLTGEKVGPKPERSRLCTWPPIRRGRTRGLQPEISTPTVLREGGTWRAVVRTVLGFAASRSVVAVDAPSGRRWTCSPPDMKHE